MIKINAKDIWTNLFGITDKLKVMSDKVTKKYLEIKDIYFINFNLFNLKRVWNKNNLTKRRREKIYLK